jgi:hypothetical protein
MEKIGYGRPPRHSQFRPGESGNPRGRPKRTPSFRDSLLAELAETVVGPDGDRTMTKQICSHANPGISCAKPTEWATELVGTNF